MFHLVKGRNPRTAQTRAGKNETIIMKKLTQKELDAILESHAKWLHRDGGRKANLARKDLRGLDFTCAKLNMADLEGADLRATNLNCALLVGANLGRAILEGANLKNADLSNANLNFAKLSGAQLIEATLSGANMCGVDLSDADLSRAVLRYSVCGNETSSIYANLRNADLSGADLRDVNFSYADLSGANLSYVNLIGANLNGVTLDESEQIRRGIMLKEPMIGYKKCRYGVIVTLKIPKGAIVLSINNGKCRTNTAEVIDVEGINEVVSLHDPTFVYRKGETVYPDGFDCRYNQECGAGIHFFRTKEEAENY